MVLDHRDALQLGAVRGAVVDLGALQHSGKIGSLKVFGAAAGGLLGALVGMGVPEEDAKHFDQGFRSGGTLVTVSAGNRVEEARTCLSESGADLGSMGRDMSSAVGSSRGSSSSESAQSIELREEELRAEKKRVQAGEVRVRKEVVSEERTIDVPISETTGNRGGIHNSLTRLLVKPTHLAGGYAQMSFAFNYLGPTGNQRDEITHVRKRSQEVQY